VMEEFNIPQNWRGARLLNVPFIKQHLY